MMSFDKPNQQFYLSDTESYIERGKDYTDVWDTAVTSENEIISVGEFRDSRLIVGIIQHPKTGQYYLLLRDISARHFIKEIDNLVECSKFSLKGNTINFGNSDLLISYGGDGMFFERLRVPAYQGFLRRDMSRSKYGKCPGRIRIDFSKEDLVSLRCKLQHMILGSTTYRVFHQDDHVLDFSHSSIYTKQMMIAFIDTILQEHLREFAF